VIQVLFVRWMRLPEYNHQHGSRITLRAEGRSWDEIFGELSEFEWEAFTRIHTRTDADRNVFLVFYDKAAVEAGCNRPSQATT